jgi:hypothetical protein
MRHQTLRIAAYCLGVLAWVVAIIGVAVSIIIGIGAATFIARVSFLLGGLVAAAISALVMLAASRLIYLLIDIEEDLSQIIGLLGKDKQ